MSTPALTVNPATPLLGIVGLFRSKNVNRVPVIDDAGRLCGIVSRGDIVRLLGFRG
jgi:CBS domain-containing protein